MKQFVPRRIVSLLCASGVILLSNEAMASAYQLWEQDGASMGSYHAGYAAQAADASTAFYNPAGITRFKNQQAVFGSDEVISDIQFDGKITVNTTGLTNAPVRAQGGAASAVPFLHYVAPINDWIGFGFSIAAPFGLKTDYGRSTYLRYTATETSVKVIDVSPALGVQLTDKISLGGGLDIQRMFAEFDLVGGSGGTHADSTSINKLNDTGYGYHLGGLYQYAPETRVGLSYHSKVRHHLSGRSTFSGPIPQALNEGPAFTARPTANITLPAYTALSVYHRVVPNIALMATAIHTQWNSLKTIDLHGIAGVDSHGDPSRSISTSIPQYYRNTWNFSLGGEYYINDKFTLRNGIGLDQTPVRDQYRNVQLPDNDRYVIAFGGHYQASKAIGVDLGWSHFFFHQAHVNPPMQTFGAQHVTTDGSVNGAADVYGLQLTWDMV